MVKLNFCAFTNFPYPDILLSSTSARIVDVLHQKLNKRLPISPLYVSIMILLEIVGRDASCLSNAKLDLAVSRAQSEV